MTQTREAQFLVTSCPEHGTVEAPDLRTFRALLPAIRSCIEDVAHEEDHEHYVWHAACGTACWQCCDDMVVDPFAILPGR